VAAESAVDPYLAWSSSLLLDSVFRGPLRGFGHN